MSREVAVEVRPTTRVSAVALANRVEATVSVSRSALITVAAYVPVSGGEIGVSDHGALTGLGDDDHPHYVTDARHALIDHTGLPGVGVGGGGIAEAPIDGTPYARQDASWVAAPSGGGDVEEAPQDGSPYARQDAGWVAVSTIEGPPGADGADGPPGPPGGAVLSGNWTYSTATTGPAATGQVRTDPALANLNDTGALWVNVEDADGLDWSAVSVEAGDKFYLRSFSGEQWVLLVDVVNGSGDYTVTLVSTTGTAPKKNETVQVSLVKEAQGRQEVYDQPDEPADNVVLWWDSDATGSAPVSYWRAWYGTQAAYDALGAWDSGTLYIIEGP